MSDTVPLYDKLHSFFCQSPTQKISFVRRSFVEFQFFYALTNSKTAEFLQKNSQRTSSKKKKNEVQRLLQIFSTVSFRMNSFQNCSIVSFRNNFRNTALSRFLTEISPGLVSNIASEFIRKFLQTIFQVDFHMFLQKFRKGLH